jgi:hypothetical protein
MAGLDEAIAAALNGPERKDIEISGHGFNVKPCSRDNQANGDLHVKGQISHKLTHRPDDQIYYHIVKKDGLVMSIDADVKNGGWPKVAGPIGSAIAGYFGKPIPPNVITDAMQKVADVNPDGWAQACDTIITAIAVRA